jgi:pyruvate-formate lyase-activating enzyme
VLPFVRMPTNGRCSADFLRMVVPLESDVASTSDFTSACNFRCAWCTEDTFVDRYWSMTGTETEVIFVDRLLDQDWDQY